MDSAGLNADDAALSPAELEDIFESLPDVESLIPVGITGYSVDAGITAPSTICWGGLLARDTRRCHPITNPMSNHFKHKLCSNCQSNGIKVPIERVRAIHQNLHNMFTNSSSSGVWSEFRLNESEETVGFRLINQTSKCSGHRLVIFRSPPTAFVEFASLPAGIECDGFVRLKLCKGTLTPQFNFRETWQEERTDEALNGARSTTAPKRARNDDWQNATLTNAKSSSPSSSPSPSCGGSAAEEPTNTPSPRMTQLGRLVALHVQLDDEITHALGHSISQASCPPLTALDERRVSSGSASRPAQGLPAQPSSGDTLMPAQRQGLAELQASLRSSLTLLRSEVGVASEEGPVAANAPIPPLSWLPLVFSSNPPSPPGSSRASTRPRGPEARWSTGLCACFRDQLSCLCVVFCWPIIVGQLGQKIVRSRSLCTCFALPMLGFLLLFEVPMLWNVATAPMRMQFMLASLPANQTPMRMQFMQAYPPANQTARLVDSLRVIGWRAAPGDQVVPRRSELAPRRTEFMLWVAGQYFGAIVLFVFLLRTLVRLRDGIPGSPLRDFCVALFCSSCGICQLARHEGLVAGQYGGILSPTGEKKRASSGDVEAVSV